MEKAYQHEQIEATWQQRWEELNIAKPSGSGKPYCIVIPPPNVTGTLHMGHGFQLTLMDCLIRFHRMCGYNTLWQAGTDHAGIATQMVVERNCEKEGQRRHDIGREKFVEKIWEWKEHSGQKITQQMRRLGTSLDWSRERFTLDEHYSKTVKQVFVDLYQKDLIFRGERLVNWDPVLTTAVSDLEVINEERKGHLWYIKYPVSGQTNQYLVVATTRPETMLGDQAVAVHPDDARYKKWLGKTLDLPLTNRTIPVIADAAVDPEFGTGCVKITPAHDFNDYEMGQRHQLASLNILTKDGHLNTHVPQIYQGLERFNARKSIVSDLEKLNLIEKIEDHVHMVPVGDRSGAILEPFLTNQWFVKGEPIAKPALDTVLKKHIEFIPENWVNTYNHWLNNIQDWCISRQLWWGHRIPAWYDTTTNEVYVGISEKHVRKHYQLDENVKLVQDEDVLDTWFSSALWPFATLGWPESTTEYQQFYPNSVLVTGFDIIFFWVARMVMMGLECTQQIPFSQVYITGLIRDFQGKKMSKSKGNVIDPIDLIDGIDLESLVEKRTKSIMQDQLLTKVEKRTRKEYPEGIQSYGADALRFTFCALASTGRDVRFDVNRLEGYRNFCNKLWNASRFVLAQMPSETIQLKLNQQAMSTTDLWIMSQLQNTIKASHDHLRNYRFDLLSKTLYEFVWHDYCDWYLELTKISLKDSTQLTQTHIVLMHVLDQILKLLHPIIPFITESIWEKVSEITQAKDTCLALSKYPEYDKNWLASHAMVDVDWIKTMITQIRTLRADLNIPPNTAIQIILDDVDANSQEKVTAHLETLTTMLKIESLTYRNQLDSCPISATVMVGQMKCLIPLAGLINENEEINRIEKAMIKLQKKCEQAQTRLSNPHYCKNSPPELVQKLQKDCTNWLHAIEKYKEHKDILEQLKKESSYED